MKIRVIDYKNDGNTLTTKIYEVEQIGNGVFISKDSESDLYFVIFGDIQKNAYVGDGFYALQTIMNNKDYLENVAANFFEFTLNKSFIRKIDIEYAKCCGLDYVALEKRRNEIFVLKEKEEQEKLLQNQKEQEEYKRKKTTEIATALTALKNGEKISYSDLLDIITEYKIKIAPRTLGAIRKQNIDYFKVDLVTINVRKGTAQSTINSIFKVINEIVNN